uniref:Uncharacterized protein n=1 Tax=Acyrthosiphon pisum TaxID=7029 RepID=C4WX57_ACYPI|nr:hypothetical protein [Acyrthosiphon pisum]
MKPLNLAVLLFCLIAYGHSRPSDNDEHDEIIREAKRDNKHFQQYRLPYWAFVPTLGVWPGVAGTGSGTGSAVAAAAATISPPPRGSVAVNLNSGRVTVVDDVADRSEVGDMAADPNRKRWPAQVKPLHPNTPSVGGPSWLRKTAVAAAASSDPVVQAAQ